MKNLFEISSEEKNRILEMHINATKRQYLMEETRTLTITVTDESGIKLPYVTIIDMGDKTNGTVTNDEGIGILNNFKGPKLSVNFVGMEPQEITPENDNVSVVLKQSATLSTLEIKIHQFKLKIVDSKTNESIKDCVVTTKTKSGEELKITTDDNGEVQFDSTYDFNISISKDGYTTKQYVIDEKFRNKTEEKIITIPIDKIVEVPDELKYLIGKTYVFEDKNLKEPKTYKINDAQYIDNDGYITVELSVSEEELKETAYVIFECGRVIFQGYQKNEKGKRSMGKNYFYQRDLSEYLLNKTKCCNKIENNNKK